MQKAGAVWTETEIEAAVASYMDMLQTELAGGTINKAERNRMLQSRIGRSKGSIEFKHQNISAVMELLGLPFIWGYKPAVNFQRQLYEVVESHLIGHRLNVRLADRVVERAVPATGLSFGRAPDRNPRPDISDPEIRRILHTFDPAARDARARALGEAGERFLFHAEQCRLSSLGRDDLASKVRWVSKEDGDGAGFDILSFSRSGQERWLEVKTTNGSLTTPFWISENERRVSEERRDVFRLARLYDFSRKPAAYKLKPPLSDHVHLAATQYRAVF